jgi:hypothetical protein
MKREGDMGKKVKARDLIFDLENGLQSRCTITVACGTEHEKTSECIPYKENIIHRWLARKIAAYILNRGGTYQMCGWTGALKKNFECVDASCDQLAHWILRTAGYICCCADLLEIQGIDPSVKERHDNQD